MKSPFLPTETPPQPAPPSTGSDGGPPRRPPVNIYDTRTLKPRRPRWVRIAQRLHAPQLAAGAGRVAQRPRVPDPGGHRDRARVVRGAAGDRHRPRLGRRHRGRHDRDHRRRGAGRPGHRRRAELRPRRAHQRLQLDGHRAAAQHDRARARSSASSAARW